MYYFIQANEKNAWMPAMDSQIDAIHQALQTKQSVTYTITDPKSQKNFQSVCHYTDNKTCWFENLETGVKRKVFMSEKNSSLPDHDGI